MNKFADLILYNGEVITANRYNEVCEAIAVGGNKIICKGSNADVTRLADEHTDIVDLNGKSLLPGMIDSHLHLMDLGASEVGIDCSFPKVKSIEDIKNSIKRIANTTAPGTWIRGWGYDQNKLVEGRHPDRWDLDAATARHPVMISRICGHIVTCNSSALTALDICDRTTDPEGGKIERHDGKPTGLLYENAAYDVMNRVSTTYSELMEGLLLADKKLTAMGITSVHDAGGYGPLQNKVIQDAFSNGLINTRIYAMLLSYAGNKDFQEGILKTGFRSGFGNESFRMGAFKVAFIDGSSSAPTAAVIEPYTSNPNDSGMINITQGELNDLCIRAHEAGFQVTAHAVGDRAIEMFLDAIELAQKTYPREDCRHRIEHCAIVSPKIITRIKKLNMIPVSQPSFLYDFGDGYVQNYGIRTNYMFACKSYIKAGIINAGSSDCPVSPADPIQGIHSAVNRESVGGKIIGPNQRIGIMDAIRMYTINGAYASFEENIKGSLEVNKLADMVVLSGSILKCGPEKIKDLKVDMTVINGKIVYQRAI